jgi:hypothetical protein
MLKSLPVRSRLRFRDLDLSLLLVDVSKLCAVLELRLG